MKKVTFLLLLLAVSFQAMAQVLNQPASWPNTNWTITGTYVTGPTIFEANPTVSANFAYDDDDAGSAAINNIAAESPVIDLTTAFNAGETWLFLNSMYVYNNISTDRLAIQFWNADTSAWVNWGAPIAIDTPGAPLDNFCAGTSASYNSGELNIVNFTATQLSGFKYRIRYDDGGAWAWGFCFNSPTLSSQTPPACPNPNTLAVANVGGTSAVISWAALGSETNWEYIVQTAGTGVPSSNGTSVGMSSVNVMGLTYSTDYEFYVRADCGAGLYSDWVGPFTFTTTIQTNFTVDCNAGPLNNNFCYFDDIDDDPSVATFVFTSSDSSPLRLIFNSGQIESCCDELVVIDSDGSELFNGLIASGNLTGLEFQSSGDTLSFYINSDISISCESGSFPAGINYTVSCATCVNPVAAYAVRGDCAVGPQFLVDVDLTNLGTASSVTITDNQGSAPQTVGAIGQYTFGPYPNTTNVVMTVSNDSDTNCVINSVALTQEFCQDFIVDCNAGPATLTYCYTDDGAADPVLFTFTSNDGTPLNLNFNSGEIEDGWDELVVIDTDGSFIVDPADLYYGNGGDLSGLSYQSTGDTISFYINSDGIFSCETSGFTPIDATVSCATCINPTATYAVVDDCDNGQQFLIDVNITSIGDATSVTVTDNQGSAGVQATAIGIVQMGPYPFATPIVITISNDQDVNCVINSAPLQVAACPPANDNCSGAIVASVNPDESCNLVTSGTILEATPSGVPVGSCAGNPDDDVWFQFTALGEQQIITLQNFSGGTTNIDHAVYEGVCGSLVEIYCSPDNFSVTPSLTIGNIYYIRVFSGGSNSETTSFDLCINTLGPPTFCLDALPICADGGLVYPSVTGDDEAPPYIDYDCLGSVPDPTWNSIYFDTAGNYTFTLAQTGLDGLGNDIDFIVWGPFNSQQDGCYDLLPTSVADCSYSFVSIETVTLNNVQAGDVFIILITNFSQEEGTYTFTQASGPTNGTNCEIVCDVVIEYQGSEVQEDPANLGFGEPIQLCGETSIELTASSPYADFYEWYLDGFAIPDSNVETITATQSGIYQVIANGEVCEDFAFSLQVQVTLGLEPTANPVADIITCDDVSGDGFEDFDLDSQTAIILGGQDPSLFNVTYHLSQSDALSNTGALISPYTNITNLQTIWVRVEDANASFCIATTSFSLVISGTTPVATSIDIEECDDASNDGFASFNLNAHNANILNGQSATDFSVTYHLTDTDANAATGALVSPYTNISNLQTIWARVENLNAVDCYAIIDFDLIVGDVPITTFTGDFDYEVCPNATVPIIISATAQNYSPADVSIVWYQDGGIVSGETELTLPVLIEGFYEIEVTFNETGCSSIIGQQVVELESCVIPQGISPNGDGLNDTFDLSNFDVKRIEIFNRLGALVYSKDNYTNEWYGQTNNGDELPVGTYFYTMTYEGGAKQMSAWVYINK